MLALNTSDKTSVLSIIMQIYKLRPLGNFNIITKKCFSSSMDNHIYCDFSMSQKTVWKRIIQSQSHTKKGKIIAVVIFNIPGFRI